MHIPRRPWGWLVVIAIVLGVALAPGRAVAAACTGNSHDLTLTDGTASPGSGTTTTAFDFTVVYADSGGCAPDRIVVDIPGVGQFPLTHRKGDLAAGATFGRDMTLPDGTWSYRFEAASGSGPGRRTVTLTKVDPDKVRVVDPTPKPPPTAKPTPKPQPTEKPDATEASPTPRATHSSPTSTPGGPEKTAPGHDTETPSAGSVASSFGGPAINQDVSRARGGASPVASASESAPHPVATLFVSLVGAATGLLLFWLLGLRLLQPRAYRLVDGEGGSP